MYVQRNCSAKSFYQRRAAAWLNDQSIPKFVVHVTPDSNNH